MKQYLILIILFVLPLLPIKANENLNYIEITSDTLKYYPNDKKAIFEGKVEAVRGNVKIACDKMVANLKDETKSLMEDKSNTLDFSASKIDNIEILKNVIIYNGREKAQANRGKYMVDTNIITLYENVKLFQSNNELFGEKLVYNLSTGESLISSESNKRVKGLFTPGNANESK